MKRILVLALIALLGACDLADEPGTDPDDLSVSLQSSATTGTAPLRVTLTAAALNAAGTPEYRWTIADETFEGESSRAYTFTEAGTFTASVSVTDGDAEASDSVSITVTAGDGSGDGDDGGDDGDNGSDGGSAACQNPVSIPDDALEGAVRDALGKEEGDLTCADMGRLVDLSYDTLTVDGDSLPPVGSLEGLQFATNLETLSVYNRGAPGGSQPLGGLEALSALPKLRTLSLNGTGLRSIEALSRIGSLEAIDLGSNNIATVRPLSALAGLRSLNIEYNPGGVADIGTLPGLTSLDVTGSGVDDFSFLPSLKQLSALFAAGTGFADPALLSPLTRLNTLVLDDTELTSTDGLQNLVSLTHLSLSGNTIQNFSALPSLVNLETLFLSATGIADTTPLQPLAKLVELGLSGNNISDITPLVNNTGLNRGDRVDLSVNNLDVCAEDLPAIQALEARGVFVVYGDCTP